MCSEKKLVKIKIIFISCTFISKKNNMSLSFLFNILVNLSTPCLIIEIFDL